MRNFKKILSNKVVRIGLAAASLVILVGIAKLGYDRFRPADEQIAESFQVALAAIMPSTSAIAKLAVEGANCAGCIREIQDAFTGVQGIDFAYVDIAEGTVQVSFHPDKVENSDLIIEGITNLGYPATLISITNQ